MDDAELLIRRLYVDHSEALLSWALGQVSDQRDAEEVVSYTLVKAWRRYDQYDAKRGSERSWIFGIARNTAIDRHRKSKRHLRLVDDEALAGSDEGACSWQVTDLSTIVITTGDSEEILASGQTSGT